VFEGERECLRGMGVRSSADTRKRANWHVEKEDKKTRQKTS
jgi:hypothetical protein